MQLNNRGQSLVLFVLIIPILLGIFCLVIDIGNLVVKKIELDNISKLVLDYGIDHMNDENVVADMYELVKVNDDNVQVEIKFSDMEFYIDSVYYQKGFFSNILKKAGYEVRSIYKGNVDGKKNLLKIK